MPHDEVLGGTWESQKLYTVQYEKEAKVKLLKQFKKSGHISRR